VKRAELVSAEERVAGAKRAETFDSKLKEYKESFEGVITEHQERTKAVFAAVDEKEAENKRLKDLSGDVLKKLEEDAQRTQKEREKHAKDVGQALKLVEQFQARAEAAEAVSEKLREEIATRDSSEASVKATIEKVHSSIAAVTKKNTEKDDTIRQLLKSQESYSKQIKDATTALQETSNRHKKLIARAEKAERRAEAMERLCRTLREQEKEQVVVFDKVEKVDVGALRAEKPAATAESVGARVEAHAGSDGPAAEGIAEGDRDSSAGQ
jgi:chromosome segregation ATPase